MPLLFGVTLDIAEYFLLRGFEFTLFTVRDWEERFAPILAEELRGKRKHTIGKVWYVDETYVRVKGRWCYLYRGIDSQGNLVDVRLSKTRNIEAAKAFFSQALELTAQVPEQVVTDGLNSYPRAIREELVEQVIHEQMSCLKNPIEPSHRGIKQRYYPMMGFGNFESAQRFCQLFMALNGFQGSGPAGVVKAV
jgi:putative transposase